MSEKYVTVARFLNLWEARHGEIAKSLRPEFQSRPEIEEICQFPENTILAAIKSKKLLADILKECISRLPPDTNSYPRDWVLQVTKHETSKALILGALAIRADFEQSFKKRKGYVHPGRRALSKGVAVVGVSFYAMNFIKLRNFLSLAPNDEHLLEGELRNDPENPHSSSGKAVAVTIQGVLVGHLPEVLAPGVFGLIENQGGKLIVATRVWLDRHDATPPRNSVVVLPLKRD